jgi:DNA-binding NarL/FixJ family response regulator
VIVLALFVDPSPQLCRRAFHVGVSAVLDWQSSPEDIVESLEAALAGKSVLQLTLLRCILSNDRSGTGARLELSELEWLQALAEGATVAQLAATSNYSEREMFRRLRRIYDTLGAPGRVAAIASAMEQGLLV